MKYSIIIPVYNRTDELNELLQSLESQEQKDFEVVVVDDGSTHDCQSVANSHADKLNLRYFWKENGGPGPARNFGAQQAQGETLLILDSDCVLPPHYLTAVSAELSNTGTQFFGGPDKAHPSFTPTQKAISYAMTSFFTTGGLRGQRNSPCKFYPRSFNMGIERNLFHKLNGFSPMRFGEDIDLSLRAEEAGYAGMLFPEAWVWHKRRTNLKKFFKQVFCSGMARINLWKRHPHSLKIVHLLPTMFTLGLALLLLLLCVGVLICGFSANQAMASIGQALCLAALLPPLLFSLLIFFDAGFRSKSLKVGLLAVAASFVQLTGYGTGFLHAAWLRMVRGKGEVEAFKHNFYK